MTERKKERKKELDLHEEGIKQRNEVGEENKKKKSKWERERRER